MKPTNHHRKKLAREMIRLAGEMQDVAGQMKKYPNCEDLRHTSFNLLSASMVMADWAKAVLMK